ncbi:MAG: DUF4199 domain-containing protein [Bacteroidota bacterium]|nr:DUF4199 domain-containing protein [Bacteroidota bacterium]
MEQNVTTTTTKGLVIGLIMIVIAIAIYFLNIDVQGPSKWVSNIIFIGGIIWSVYNFGQQVDYNATFGNYFAHGFKVSAVVTCIMIIYLVIFMVLFPEFKEKAMEQARTQMEKGGKMTADQINQAITLTRKFFMVFAIGGTLLGLLIFGSLASLIGAAITKKDPRPIVGDVNQIQA